MHQNWLFIMHLGHKFLSKVNISICLFMTRAQNSNYTSPDHKPFKDKKKKYEHARNINLIVLFCVNYLQNIYI